MSKEWTSKYNPFNSDKLFNHVETWKKIVRRGNLPAPITVSVDPSNRCDLACNFCNAHNRMSQSHYDLSEDTLRDLPGKLVDWGVKTICVGGGGESLLNPYSGKFITTAYEQGIGVGTVTNGTRIDKCLSNLTDCYWVSVSVDAGTRETYSKIKGVDSFRKVIGNMEKLVAASLSGEVELGKEGMAHGVFYKYLMTPQNVGDIYEATRIAKEIGCKGIHIRPGSPPWFDLKDKSFDFNSRDLGVLREGIQKARELEEEGVFNIYSVTHKFDGNLKAVHNFSDCHALFMTGIVMPPSDKSHAFDWGMCCDRRGDPNLTLRNLDDFEKVREFWGSEQHWKCFDDLKIETCPRCTYGPHNQIFENAILVDNMSKDFI